MSITHVRLGWLLGAATGASALIALNRGVDLLWGVTILLAVAILVAIVLPKFQLLGVRIRRAQWPTHGTVGEPLRIHYSIDVSGPLPRYGLEILDEVPGTGSGRIAAYVPRVRGCEELSFSWTPRVRGCWQLRDVVLESRYPLGLTRSRRRFSSDVSDVASELVIYPDFVRLSSLPIRGSASAHSESRKHPARGGHDEIFSLRSYRPEDSLRSIHWRASARTGELLSKEYEQPQYRTLWIVLELSRDEHVGEGADGTFEYMIRIAHSVAIRAREDGIPVGLLFDAAGRLRQIAPGTDRGTYVQIREALARVNAAAQPALATQLDRLIEALPRGGTLLLFTPRDTAGRSALSRAAGRRAIEPLYVEFDHDSFVRQHTNAHIRRQRTPDGRVSIVSYGADLTGLFHG